MIRKIIHIDEEKCNGCGACVNACHEGAIGLVNGKAKLMHEHYCDGLGDCLPACPTNAITFEEREAPAYDEAAVLDAKAAKERPAHTGCPGAAMRQMQHKAPAARRLPPSGGSPTNWAGADQSPPPKPRILTALLCWWRRTAPPSPTAISTAAFGPGRVCLIGCPKLDGVDYTEKLTEIIRNNDVKSLTIVRMEVPCCGGLEFAAKTALQNSGKFIPWQVVTVNIDGTLREN